MELGLRARFRGGAGVGVRVGVRVRVRVRVGVRVTVRVCGALTSPHDGPR